MNTLTLLKELTQINAVAGRETALTRYLCDRLNEYGAVEVTPLGNVLCTLACGEKSAPTVMLAAHMDQIGMIVTYIDKDGFLRVAQVGGMDRRLLLGSVVTVYTKQGEIKGVICSTPPHLAGGKEDETPEVTEIYIDTGLSTEQAKEQICCGDIVTIDAQGTELLNDVFCAPALDDRAGCAALILVAQMLKQHKLNYNVVLAFTTMEETGSSGATTAANQIQPDYAVAVDVSFASAPGIPRYKCGEMGKGAMIGVAPILNYEMTQKLIACAKENFIPYQMEISGSATGTDADMIAVSGKGVKTAVLSIPQKNMHTPIETVSVQDVENTAKLMAAFLKEGLGK